MLQPVRGRCCPRGAVALGGQELCPLLSPADVEQSDTVTQASALSTGLPDTLRLLVLRVPQGPGGVSRAVS